MSHLILPYFHSVQQKETRMDLNEILVWKLLIHRLNIKDVVHLFKTCRDLWSLSKKEGLWSYLMRRDYPEHFLLSTSRECEMYYKDLHQFGGYISIRMSIPLLPYRPLYMVPKLSRGEYKLVTTRGRTSEHDFIRHFGQKYFAVENYRMLSQKQRELMKACNECIVTEYRTGAQRILLLRDVHQLNWIAMKQFRPWDGQRFEHTIAWMATHFEVDDAQLTDGRIEFNGRLRKGHLLGDKGSKYCEDFWKLESKYRLSIVKIFAVAAEREVMLFSFLTQTRYPTVNGEKIPHWNDIQMQKDPHSISQLTIH
jgi:hypothetical protein